MEISAFLGRVKPTHSNREKRRAFAFLLLMHVCAATGLLTSFKFSILPASCIGYLLMCFAAGPIMHRYFGHRAFRTSRWFQFVLALFVGCIFTDAIGFAGKHWFHHRFADTSKDVHSPHQGFWFCWFGHILDEGYTDEQIVAACGDLAGYPELVWLHRYFYLPGLAAAILFFVIGGFQSFANIYCLNFVLVVHSISAINYFCHTGRRRGFNTVDCSTNRPILGLLLFGEGWHNNHHRHPASARFGIKRYQFDAGYQLLRGLAATGLIWDLR